MCVTCCDTEDLPVCLMLGEEGERVLGSCQEHGAWIQAGGAGIHVLAHSSC